MIDTELEQAKLDQPEGIICGKCGADNDMADDLGFFYTPEPTCKKCWKAGGYSTAER